MSVKCKGGLQITLGLAKGGPQEIFQKFKDRIKPFVRTKRSTHKKLF
jgi:hypothetical protein